MHCSTGSQNVMDKRPTKVSFLVKSSSCSMSRIRQKFLVLSGLSPRLSNEEVKEEMMRCFSPITMRRQGIEMMRTMHQEDDEQMHQYIMRHEVAHARAHRLSPDDQLSSSEIIEFVMTLQPIIQDKLLKRIDGNRPPRSLREAYHQALDLERKNQITKRYETTVQVSQISDCMLEENIDEIDAMGLHPRDNTKRVPWKR